MLSALMRIYQLLGEQNEHILPERDVPHYTYPVSA